MHIRTGKPNSNSYTLGQSKIGPLKAISYHMIEQ